MAKTVSSAGNGNNKSEKFGLSVLFAGVQSFFCLMFPFSMGEPVLKWLTNLQTFFKNLINFTYFLVFAIVTLLIYIPIYIFSIFQPSGRQVTKKSASSEVRPKLALPPETETANRKNFGLLQTVGRVHRLRGEKPKTTNLWDLTEILYNAPKTNQKR